MSVASPSDAGYDVTALQEMLDDYEWQVMQSESLDTSVDNASIYQTAQNTSLILYRILCFRWYPIILVICRLKTIR